MRKSCTSTFARSVVSPHRGDTILCVGTENAISVGPGVGVMGLPKPYKSHRDHTDGSSSGIGCVIRFGRIALYPRLHAAYYVCP